MQDWATNGDYKQPLWHWDLTRTFCMYQKSSEGSAILVKSKVRNVKAWVHSSLQSLHYNPIPNAICFVTGTFGTETDSYVSCEREKDTEKSYSHNGRKTSLCKVSYYLVKEGTSWRWRKELNFWKIGPISPHERASASSGCLGFPGPLETRHLCKREEE